MYQRLVIHCSLFIITERIHSFNMKTSMSGKSNSKKKELNIMDSNLYMTVNDNFLYNLACVQSYGEYCRNPCSLQCYNDTCDKINGRCLIGCKDGFYSELCDKGTM